MVSTDCPPAEQRWKLLLALSGRVFFSASFLLRLCFPSPVHHFCPQRTTSCLAAVTGATAHISPVESSLSSVHRTHPFSLPLSIKRALSASVCVCVSETTHTSRLRMTSSFYSATNQTRAHGALLSQERRGRTLQRRNGGCYIPRILVGVQTDGGGSEGWGDRGVLRV